MSEDAQSVTKTIVKLSTQIKDEITSNIMSSMDLISTKVMKLSLKPKIMLSLQN